METRSTTPPVDDANEGEVDEIVVGDCVDITPLPGRLAMSGMVVACRPEGFDLIRLDNGIGHPDGPWDFAWDEVDEYEVLEPPATLTVEYRGRQQADTFEAVSRDAGLFARAGFRPSTQSWAQGQWGAGAFLAALVLCFVLVGLLVFLYMLIVKPPGTLTVTYEHDRGLLGDAAEAADPGPNGAGLTLRDRLEQLGAAHGSGLVTDEEFERKRAQLIDGL
jgi:hypothetical protein